MFLSVIVLVGLYQVQATGTALAARMADSDLSVRAAAIVELNKIVASDSATLLDTTVQEALVALLERENAAIAENFAAVVKGGQHRLDEPYAEYYAIVLGLANSVRKQGAGPALDPRLTRALVLGSYNPDSDFAKDLATEGESIVPLVIELTNASVGPKKWNGYGLIGELFVKSETNALKRPMSAASMSSLRAAARAGLLDPAPDVRIWAITAVSKARDKEAIPLLQRMAQTDPDTDKGPSKYSVRSVAAEALRNLR